jgi:hypothetical protein
MRGLRPQYGAVESDRPCPGCGYNLRGLPLDGHCPECGTAVQASRRALDDPLSRMPVEVVRVFRRGGWAATLCVLAVIGLIIGRHFITQKVAVQAAAVAAISLLWWVAVLAITPAVDLPQAHFHGFSEKGRLRRVTRVLQLAWLVYATIALMVALLPPLPSAGQSLVTAMMGLARLAGVVGVVCLSIVLRRLSEWVRDDGAERAFEWFAWAFPIAYLLYVYDPTWPWRAFTIVAMIGAMLLLPWGIFSLSRSMHYSLIHAREKVEHDKRSRERQRRDAERVADAVARMDRARGV